MPCAVSRPRPRRWFFGIVCAWLLLAGQLPAAAQTVPLAPPAADAGGWTIDDSGEGVTLAWQATGRTVWPEAEINGLLLPARLFAFAGTGPLLPRLRIHSQRSQPLSAEEAALPRVTPPVPQTIDGAPRPGLAPAVTPTLPAAPVTILRRGRMRGVDLLVVAVSQRFSRLGQPHTLSALHFSIEGARLLENIPTPAELSDQPLRLADVPAPWPLLGQSRVRVRVEETGMQEILLDDLRGMGFLTDASQAGRLQLFRNAQPVALEAPGDRLGFYAPPPGDRWNRADFYQLLLLDTPGLRMQHRPPVGPGAASLPTRAWAWETGRWAAPAIYDSTLAGEDGDHWFGLDLRAGPELPVITHTLPISSVLPPLAASATVTLHVAGYTKGNHQLRLTESGGGVAQLFWEGSGERSLSFAVDSRGQSLALATVEGAAPDGVLVDSMTWQRPVALGFGYSDGLFVNGAEQSLLHLSQVAAISRLYDITDPRQPVRVELPALTGGSLLLESAPHSRFLLLADQTRLFFPLVVGGQNTEVRLLAEVELLAPPRAAQPSLELLPPLDFAPFLNTDALYIAPARFHSTLQPLLEQRASQGYSAGLVDVAALYEGWSGGYVDPAAIRDFVRWVTANSSRPPQAVVLVGDATSDPLNYTGRNNTNFVPPYLLPVDRWLGETACDSCFGQVDGASPLDDSLPDIPVGRIPAKSADEVAFYVEKLLAYERTPAPLAERSRVVVVADNYRDANGQVDGAGDFAITADAAVAEQPPGTQIERIYYDPSPSHTQNPWREPDGVVAWRKTLAALNRGAGFVTYAGHAHHWQWASTDLNVEPPYLLGLYDADGLTNQANLPILLAMSCLTGMFQLPAFSGTTIDERLLLHTKGGAAAIWSSAGISPAYGHDLLQRGFYRQFWSLTGDKRLGALTQAGYLALFAEKACCQESLRTFVLLGDPLTIPQAAAERKVWMPWVGR